MRDTLDPPRSIRRRARVLVLGAVLAALAACTSTSPAPSASAVSSTELVVTPPAPSAAPSGIPKTDDQIDAVINPRHEPPYSGPTATVYGRVTIVGDPPPDVSIAPKPECHQAAAMYSKLFRRGPNGELADAMVAVTKYNGFVPTATKTRSVKLSGCAFDTRTVVATYGQKIEVFNVDDTTTYMPYLDGAPFRAMLVALPKSRPVPLFALEPGHYLLRDVMPNPFEIADVFVVPYATFDVTAAPGTFTIPGVPVGTARIDAFLPIINKSVGKDLTLVEGTNEVNLELTFSAATDKPVPVPAPIWGDRAHP